MPNYMFRCRKCGEVIEQFMTFKEFDEKGELEHNCGGKLEIDFHLVPVHYKGAGFYISEQRGIKGYKRKPNVKVGLKADLENE